MSDLIEAVQDESPISELEFSTHLPGILKTIKRNGKVVRFDESKIKVALTKAFIAVEGGSAASSNRIYHQIDEITRQMTHACQRRLPSGGIIHIEDIQDQVELALMRNGQYKVARAYVLYREERRKAREAEHMQISHDPKVLLITHPSGELKPLDIGRVQTIVDEACRNLDQVEPDLIIKDALRNLFNQAKLSDVHKALIMSARAMVEREPNYTYVSARLLLDSLRSEALTHLHIRQEATFDEMTAREFTRRNLFVIRL